MGERERFLERRRLDKELRPFRQAGKDKNPTNGLLRAVRKALGVPLAEIAAKMGVGGSMVYDFEARELSGSLKMNSMARVADALGCKMVYGIVPTDGQTLEELAAERLWKKVMEDRRRKSRESGKGNREQERPSLAQRLASTPDDPVRLEELGDGGTGDLGTGDLGTRDLGTEVAGAPALGGGGG